MKNTNIKKMSAIGGSAYGGNKRMILKVSALIFFLILLFGASKTAKAECDPDPDCWFYNCCGGQEATTTEPTDSDGWTQSACVADGGSWEGGQCMESTSSDCNTGLEDYDGTCYSNLTEYCNAVDDQEKCGTAGCQTDDDCPNVGEVCSLSGICVENAVGGSCRSNEDCAYEGEVCSFDGQCVQNNTGTSLDQLEEFCTANGNTWRPDIDPQNPCKSCEQIYGNGYVWKSAWFGEGRCVGTENSPCENNSNCDTGCKCDENSRCATSWGGFTGGCDAAPAPSPVIPTGGTDKTPVGTVTKETTVTDKFTGKQVTAKPGDVVYSDGSIMTSSGLYVAAPNSAQFADSSGQGGNSSGLSLVANGMMGPVYDQGQYPGGYTGSGGYNGGGLPGNFGTGGSGGAVVFDCGEGFQKVGGVCFPTTTGLSAAPIYVILSNLFSWLMGLFTTFAVLAFVVSGIQYLTAAGSDDQMQTAKRNATYAILGIVVGLSGFIIVQAIAAALSGQSYLF